jgi:hypothetical protein
MPDDLTVDTIVQSNEMPSIPSISSNSYDCTCSINCRSLRNLSCIIIAILCLFGFCGFMAYALISKGYDTPSSISSNVTAVPSPGPPALSPPYI